MRARMHAVSAFFTVNNASAAAFQNSSISFCLIYDSGHPVCVYIEVECSLLPLDRIPSDSLI
jgi:hypothetical protein